MSQGLNFSKVLNVCHINLNCLTNKIVHVSNLLSNYHIHILTISETWLNSQINDSTVNISGFQIVRSDNPGSARKHGVAIYICNSIKFHVVDCLLNVLTVYLIDFDVYLVSVYRPPSYSDTENSNLINYLLNFCCDKEVVVLGDFNLPSLNWRLDDLFSQYISPLDRQFYDVFSQVGLYQIVNESTHFPSGNILDLVLTTNSERIGLCNVLCPLPRCSHRVGGFFGFF